MIYEDLEFFENKSTGKEELFRFRLVESPMLLNATGYNSEDFVDVFQKERKIGLQCFLECRIGSKEEKKHNMNVILVPQY